MANDKEKKVEATEESIVEETQEETSQDKVEATSSNKEKAQDEPSVAGNVYEGEAEVLSTDEIDGTEKNWAMFTHLGAFAGCLFPFGFIIAPLVIWLIKKDSSAFIDDQGKEAVNFQITMLIGYAIATVLVFAVIGVLLWPLLLLFHFIMTIIAAIKTSEGEKYRYPFAIRLIK